MDGSLEQLKGFKYDRCDDFTTPATDWIGLGWVGLDWIDFGRLSLTKVCATIKEDHHSVCSTDLVSFMSIHQSGLVCLLKF